MPPPKQLLDRSAAGVWLDANRRDIRRAYIADSPDIRAVRSEHGTSLHLTRPAAAGSGRVQQYLLTDASNGNYFICRSLSVSFDTTDPEDPFVVNTIGATDIYIAKPFHLRQSPFDRAAINVDAPENIGTTNEITYDIAVESWNGSVLSTTTRRLSHDYKSATFRIVTDETEVDPDDWTTQSQTIIPRFVPANLVLFEGETLTDTISPTIIYAIACADLGITYLADANTVDITLLALNDGWAWSKTS